MKLKGFQRNLEHHRKGAILIFPFIILLPFIILIPLPIFFIILPPLFFKFLASQLPWLIFTFLSNCQVIFKIKA